MNSKHDPNRVVIFDTTLRDGEQSPGASMNLDEKLVIARTLRDLGVDVIEAGFPIASPGDFEAVHAIAKEIRGPIIAGLARCAKGDIDRCWEAVQVAENKRIHVFLATSAIHREHKLRMAKEEIVRKTREAVSYARTLCEDIEFSAEDAARTEPEFLAEVVEAAISAGATTVNIPDTVGYAMPAQYSELITYLKDNVPNIDEAIISVHCHNDLGMAVANSLAATQAGARQVECTINGIGERAGNCSLEEIVMALRTRHDYFGLTTGINTEKIWPASQQVSSITGLQVQRNKAIVGRNAFAHEAGIHQHGVMQHQETYEIMKPEDVGVVSNELVLGKHSGRHAFRKWVEEHHFDLDDERFEAAFAAFKKLADEKKEIFDADLEALLEGSYQEQIGPWELVALQTSAGANSMAAVTLKNVETGEIHEEAAPGHGPVEALYRSIERIVGKRIRLTSYRINSVTSGKDAMGDVHVEVLLEEKPVIGRAINTNIIEGSARALINVVNRHIKRVGREASRTVAGATP